MLTPTDLTEIERKASAYQAEESANPEAKTCQRPTPELVLRLVEHIKTHESILIQEQMENENLRAKVADVSKDRDDAHAAWAALSNASDQHRATIRELQAIVDRLPKTADGVPITPGMHAFFLSEKAPLIIEAIVWSVRDSGICCTDGYYYGKQSIFSSAEAIEAAQAQKGGAQ